MTVFFQYHDYPPEKLYLKADSTIQTIMNDFYESRLKERYRDWYEASEFLYLEGIPRKKYGQHLNLGENSQTKINKDYWVNSVSNFTEIKAKFEMKLAESLFKTINCNAYCLKF